MLKLATSNPTIPPKPVDPSDPCPHGFAFAGNCVRCVPPPKYAPMNGSKTR